MAEAFGVVTGACGLADQIYSALKKLVVRGKKIAHDLESVDSRIHAIDVDFRIHTRHFITTSRAYADCCKKDVEHAFNNIKKPPAQRDSFTMVAKLKYKAFLMCYGIRHGKEVERKLVDLRQSINKYEEAVRPSGGKTRHTYVEGLPNVASGLEVGLDRADEVVRFVKEWEAFPINATTGASSFKLCFVGIVGHGGLGKSTLLYHSLKKLKEISDCFKIVAQVELSDKLNPEDLKEKQASLINQLLQGVATYEKLQTLHQGRNKLEEIFKGFAESGESVCITIDDVWTIEDLQNLLPVMTIDSFTCCIMVTSQVQDIVDDLKLHCAQRSDCCCCHVRTFKLKLKPMSEEDSKRLLVAQATVYDEASSSSTLFNDEVSKLAEEIYPFCCNLPKALMLTGNKLAKQKDPIFWDEWKVDMAEGRPGLAAGLELLNNLLDRGYQKLDGDSQAVVCGIATCFKGWPKQTAINIAGNKAMDKLVNYSLLPADVPVESSLKMQGLIQKLAHACVDSRNDIKWGLELDWSMLGLQWEAFGQVKYLQLDVRNNREFRGRGHLNVEGTCFVNMRQLRVLDMLGPFNCSGLLQFPESLRFLKFQHNNCLKKVFESMKFPSSLRHLELHGCLDLRELPATAYICGSLFYLRIVGCPDLIGLRGTTNTQGIKLQVLCLEDCPSITQLPVGDLGELQRLLVNNCKGLEESQYEWAPKLCRVHVEILPSMPSSSSQVSSSSLPPAHCDLDGISQLSSSSLLPAQCDSNGISQLSSSSLLPAQCDPRAASSALSSVSAETLNAAEVSINELHEPTEKQVAQKMTLTISQYNKLSNDEAACLTNLTILACYEPHQRWSPSVEMKCLKRLKIKDYGWINLERDLFTKVSQLTKLCLENCHQLTELPDSLGSLELLEELTLKLCYKLWKLPDTIGNLQSLKRLSLVGCAKIERLPDTVIRCALLEELSLQMCSSRTCLPQNLDTLKNLKILQFYRMQESEQ